MKILVACEESQIVTKEFRRLGHEAYSCDLLPCSGGHPEWHMEEDVKPWIIDKSWDMIIAFPPCTHLCISGARWFKEKILDGRQQDAIDFFMWFFKFSRASKIAVENPIGIMSTKFRKPDQIIQPWQFGHETTKATCLWLKGLPKLKPTNIVSKGERIKYASGRSSPKWHIDTWNLSPTKRAIARSKTFPGIAKAMAEQWS